MGLDSNFICNDSTRCLTINDIDYIEPTIAGLTEKQYYFFKVRVYNKLGKFTESAVIYQKTPNLPPESVFLFEAENVTETTAKLRWRKSNDSEFEKYTINRGNNIKFEANSDNVYATVANRNDTTLLLTGLTPNEGYIFRVCVYDKYLSYTASNVVGFSATKGGLLPAPEILSIVADSQTYKVTISWVESTSSLFTYYFVYSSPDSSKVAAGQSTVYWQSNASTTSYTTSIVRGITYYLRVSSLDIFGKYSYSKIRSVRLP